MFEFHSTFDLVRNGDSSEKNFLAPTVKSDLQKDERIRVVRIAHASLTPALRGRERGLAKRFPQLDMEVIAPPRWRETGVDVETVPDDLFPVTNGADIFLETYTAFRLRSAADHQGSAPSPTAHH